jgi:outer membrane biosynthesis protein TonB
MKLTEKAKKRLTLAGLGIVCVVLVIAIASQLTKKAPQEADVQPSTTAANTVTPTVPTPKATATPTTTPEVSVKPITPTESASQVTDTGESTETDQSIQADVTKPPEPSEEVKTDPTKKPDGEKVTTVTSVEHEKVTKPESSKSHSSSSTPKSGDKNDKGQVYVPGFGWVDDEGVNKGTQVGNDDDELTGNKVGSMD